MLLSDLFFVALCVFAASFVSDKLQKLDTEIRVVGFFALMVLGISTYLKKAANPNELKTKGNKNILYIMKGIIINSINPLTLLFWLGLAAFVKSSLPTLFEVVLFFSVTLGAMFFHQFIICYSANKVKHLLSVKMQQLLNHIIGVVFIIVAFAMLWPVIKPYFENIV